MPVKIKELFSDPSRWTQGAFARDKDGNEVSPRSRKAVCWCLEGATEKCYKGDDIFEAARTIHRGLGDHEFVAVWNDNKKRKFEEIKALVEKLDI